MGKNNSYYICQTCGASFVKWSGKCAECGTWNSLVEEVQDRTLAATRKKGTILQTTPLTTNGYKIKEQRDKTDNSEIDQVLGGGFVKGSVNLLAGQPGVGKSTLLLQLAGELAKKHEVLYVSGEESLSQINLRAGRLGTRANKLRLAVSTDANDVAATISQKKIGCVIVDSIQTMMINELTSSAGTVSQITGCTQLLAKAAKSANTTLILVGHVTKEGSIAGPKILEHMVDVVLQLEGDQYGGFKVLRSAKNRYGSTNEVGIFEMTDKGLKVIKNPSAALLAERQISDGSIVAATIEGSRAILVEVQALVNRTNFGYPKRAASGFDYNRLNLLIAMLSRRTKLDLSDKDVYVNMVGGIRTDEPAVDLAVCMAIASAAKGMALQEDAVVFGEVGLSGEVRSVQLVDKRVKEAQKLNFKYAIGPASGEKQQTFIRPVKNVRDALNTYLSK